MTTKNVRAIRADCSEDMIKPLMLSRIRAIGFT
jgi:hypothetical protein